MDEGPSAEKTKLGRDDSNQYCRLSKATERSSCTNTDGILCQSGTHRLYNRALGHPSEDFSALWLDETRSSQRISPVWAMFGSV